MEKGLPFSLQYVTANLSTGVGGSIKSVKSAFKRSAISSLDGKPKEKQARLYKNDTSNTTITLYFPQEKKKKDKFRTVHLYLITQFNGKTVV